MKKRILISILLFAILIINGCKTTPVKKEKDYNRALLPSEKALVKITNPREIPDFTNAFKNPFLLEEAVNNSLDYMSKPSSETFFPICGISHEQVKKSLKSFKEILNSKMTPEQKNQLVRDRFDVYTSIGCDNRGTVLFTGYYTPIFNGSLKKSERFKYPLYKQPSDLVKDDKGNILGRRAKDGTLSKYPSRAELQRSNILDGNELLWLEDPFEVYIAHVQGSAKIRLPDNKLITVGYAATNGHEYKSISNNLANRGMIPIEKMSLSAMIKFFKANPNQVEKYTNSNPRFVFFRITKTDPTGSLNEPVIPMRSIATDKTIFPRASICFIDTKVPRKIGSMIDILPYQGFVLDQDTGGAIRAAGRCDIYVGQGDDAGIIAGKTYQEGRLYYLIAK